MFKTVHLKNKTYYVVVDNILTELKPKELYFIYDNGNFGSMLKMSSDKITISVDVNKKSIYNSIDDYKKNKPIPFTDGIIPHGYDLDIKIFRKDDGETTYEFSTWVVNEIPTKITVNKFIVNYTLHQYGFYCDGITIDEGYDYYYKTKELSLLHTTIKNRDIDGVVTNTEGMLVNATLSMEQQELMKSYLDICEKLKKANVKIVNDSTYGKTYAFNDDYDLLYCDDVHDEVIAADFNSSMRRFMIPSMIDIVGEDTLIIKKNSNVE